MRGRTNRTSEKDAKFFRALSEGKTVSASLPPGYSRTSVYEWRRSEPEFSQAWDSAIQTAIERLEEEADRRAVTGIDKPVTYQGRIVDTYKEYSDTLLIFRLKALAPEKYRDNIKTEHVGEVSIKVVYDN